MQLRLDVGVSATSSLTAVLRTFVAASAAARKTVATELGGAVADAARIATAAAQKAGKEQVASAQKAAAAHKLAGQIQADIIRSIQAQRNAEHKQFLADLKEEEREAKKAAKAIADERKKAAKAAREEEQKRERVGSAAMRTFGGYARAGLGVARDVASGLGVDFSLQGGLRRSVERDALARDISVQGFRDRPGEKAQDPQELLKTAEALGDKLKIDPTKVLAGLSKFQALTGDLDTGKAALGDMARLAKAFNVDLDKMVGAAGQVSSALGDVGEGKEFATAEEKAKALLEVMKGATAQGQEGAIEIGDLTSQYAKLKGAGIRFEGAAGQNILKMSALAQMSYQMGGAGSVSQASNAVMAFVNTLATSARRAKFKEAGVEIDSKEAGKFVDPYEIIKRALKATGGDTDKMKGMFANVLGEKAVNALAAAYRSAGGGDKGLKAVDEQFARFGGSVTEGQIQTNLATQMGSKESQAQAFQNELDKVTAQLGTELAPALKDLAPYAIQAAKALAGLVEFGAQNPGIAITTAIVASIGKAAIGESVGKALTGAVGGVGAVLAVGMVALTAEKVIFDAKDEAGNRRMRGDLEIDEAKTIAKGAQKTGLITDEDKKKFDEDVAKLAQRVQNAEHEQVMQRGYVGTYLGAGINYVTGGPDLAGIKQGQDDAAKLPELKQQLAELQAMKAALATGIKIANVAEIAAAVGGRAPGPGVDSGARSGGVP